MSSSYYILCLSHDPAITARDCSSPEAAQQAIEAGIEGHLGCDLLIERVSGAPVEYGCPPQLQSGKACFHSVVLWVDADWLRLLAHARKSTDPRTQEAARRVRASCWTPDRVHRLRQSLGIEP